MPIMIRYMLFTNCKGSDTDSILGLGWRQRWNHSGLVCKRGAWMQKLSYCAHREHHLAWQVLKLTQHCYTKLLGARKVGVCVCVGGGGFVCWWTMSIWHFINWQRPNRPHASYWLIIPKGVNLQVNVNLVNLYQRTRREPFDQTLGSKAVCTSSHVYK